MKNILKNLIRTSFSPRGLALAALLVAGSAQTSRAGSADPSAGGSFTWDLLSSGSGQRGIALITFSNNQTFHGYQMLAAVPPPASTGSGDGRGGSDGRGDTSGSKGSTNRFFYGFSPINNGFWQFNSKGQIVGFFSEALNVTSTVTNYLATNVFETIIDDQTSDKTNLFISFATNQASVSTNFVWANPTVHTTLYTFDNPSPMVGIGSAESTNNVSFVGTVVSNRRLTLLCTTTFGKVTYKGIPAVAALDLHGNWIGTKNDGLKSAEFFDLASFSTGNPFSVEFPDLADFPNVYFTTNGLGAGYSFAGVAMFSQHKTVGFTFLQNDGTSRSTIGSLKATRIGPTANTLGLEQPVTRVNFTATLQH